MVSKIRDMTVEEYLAFDEASDIRNEYIDGVIIPMTGGTGNHSAMIASAIAAFVNALAEKDCVVRSGDMRVRIDDTKYVYPDLSVVCGESIFQDEKSTILANPTVVVEVTSPSSLARDHVDKVTLYSAVTSIQGYLILDQERAFAEWYTRRDDGWHLQQFSSPDDDIYLEPLDCQLSLAQVYRGIVFEN